MRKQILTCALGAFLGIGVFFAFSPSASAAADTCTWTGTASSNWNNAGNWTGCDNGNLPENSDSLYFPAIAATKSTDNDFVGASFAKLSFENGYTATGNALTLTGVTASAMTTYIDFWG